MRSRTLGPFEYFLRYLNVDVMNIMNLCICIASGLSTRRRLCVVDPSFYMVWAEPGRPYDDPRLLPNLPVEERFRFLFYVAP